MRNLQNRLLRAPSIDEVASEPARPLQTYFFFFLIMIYLFSIVIEGPLRYVLVYFEEPQLIYLRDLIQISIILMFFIRYILLGTFPYILIYLTIILLFHSVIGYYYMGNLIMIAFGWKIMLNVIFGVIAYHIIGLRNKNVVRYFIVFLFIGLVGIFMNYFIVFPWEGLEYNVGSYAIEGTRSWQTWGLGEEVKRISGFAKLSIDAAIQVTLFTIFVIPFLKKNWIKAIIWLLLSVAILLTTTKGLMINYICLSIFFIFYSLLPNQRNLYQRFLLVAIIAACTVPFIYNLLGINDIKDSTVYALLASFMDRSENIWPDAFDMVKQGGNFFLGRGLGSLGGAQLYFETKNYNPGDNIFVFAYVYFGVFSILYFYYIYYKSKTINFATDLQYYLIILTIFIYGMVVNIFEGLIPDFFLGMALGHITNDKKSRIFSFKMVQRRGKSSPKKGASPLAPNLT